jgi:fluoroquinolone transport system permease protein
MVGLDLRLQRRYGLVQAGLIVAALWIVLLRLLPAEARSVAAPLVVFGDLAVVGYFFVGALVLFEKAEGTLAGVAVSPVRPWQVVAGRATSLTLLAALLTVAVVGLGHDGRAHVGLLAAGVVLCSVTAVLVGMAVVAPFASVSRYLMPAVVPLIVLGLPLLDALDCLPAAAVAALPTGGSWLAVEAAFSGERGGWLVIGLVANTAWIGVAGRLAVHQYRRYLAVPPGITR